jgi:hypothetical protein
MPQPPQLRSSTLGSMQYRSAAPASRAPASVAPASRAPASVAPASRAPASVAPASRGPRVARPGVGGARVTGPRVGHAGVARLDEVAGEVGRGALDSAAAARAHRAGRAGGAAVAAIVLRHHEVHAGGAAADLSLGTIHRALSRDADVARLAAVAAGGRSSRGRWRGRRQSPRQIGLPAVARDDAAAARGCRWGSAVASEPPKRRTSSAHPPPGHALPQAPQWARSVARSTQAEPHTVCPVGHTSSQRPAVHTRPAAQTLPQAPQWLRSVWGRGRRPRRR